MEVKFYKSSSKLQHTQSPEGLQVQLPGYVSNSSWYGAGSTGEEARVTQKGRVTTPPPSAAIGLHQLTLEAFWID